jgi:hypothetical protein
MSPIKFVSSSTENERVLNSKQLRDSIAKKVQSQPQEIEMASWMTRTSLELIGQSGFGFSFDSLAEDSIPHPYAVSVKRFG